MSNDVLYRLASVIPHRWMAGDTRALLKKFNRFLISVVALTTLFNVASQSLSHEAPFARHSAGTPRNHCLAVALLMSETAEILLDAKLRAHMYLHACNGGGTQRSSRVSSPYQGGVLRSDVRSQECLPTVEFGLLGFLQSRKDIMTTIANPFCKVGRNFPAV